MLERFKNPRILIAFVFDFLCAVTAGYLALFLRFESWSKPFELLPNAHSIVWITVLLQVISFQFSGLYAGMWRFSSVNDLIRIFKGVSLGIVASLLVQVFISRLVGVPRSFFIMDWLLVIMMLGSGRFAYRIRKDTAILREQKKTFGSLANTIIIGAGSAADRLFRDIKTNATGGMHVVGFVDDDPKKHNRTLHGVKVLGDTSRLPEFIEKLKVEQVFLAIPSANGSQIKRLVDICLPLGVEIKTLPKVNDILAGKIEVSLLRNVQIEDLLGREVVQLNTGKLESMIKGKTAMVTGAGGSIGSELCHQISKHQPQKVILFEMCELFLYEIEMELKAKFPKIEFIPVIGDVRMQERLDSIFEAYRPHLVFHAAAYKHVPMMEKNPEEAVKTNVFGTKNVAEMAVKYQAQKFVLISTDKAVNPTNVMGTTKRVAEMVCEDLMQADHSTEFIIVRFGNVLGSNGSVIPLFKKQIENGGPITVTHPEVTRYFMSIPEASQLVLQSAAMGNGGEVFVLDMGESVKIVDLVDRMIALAGLRKGIDIEVEFIGMRVGEKMYEELFSDKEELVDTDHKKVFKAKNRKIESDFLVQLEELRKNQKDVHFLLKTLVPEYSQLN